MTLILPKTTLRHIAQNAYGVWESASYVRKFVDTSDSADTKEIFDLNKRISELKRDLRIYSRWVKIHRAELRKIAKGL